MSKKDKNKPKKPKAPATGFASFSNEGQLLFFQCVAANSELESDAAKLSAASEALKRAQIEVQTLPGRIEELKRDFSTHQTKGQQLYSQLKEVVGCPESKEIDLKTGEFVESK